MPRATCKVIIKQRQRLLITEIHRISVSHHWQQLILLRLVIQYSPINTILVLKLLSQHRVTNRNRSLSGEEQVGMLQDTHSYFHHRRIHNARVTSRDKLSLTCHLNVTTQHVRAWNAHLISITHTSSYSKGGSLVTLFISRNPLSLLLYPYFGPMSPTSIPRT